ncbi:hypothetical protein WKK05_11320 [Nostoc sp. UHCC 0302]
MSLNKYEKVGTAENLEWIAQGVCDVLKNGEAIKALRNFAALELA